MMASDSERREVAENLRYLADYPGAPVRYAEQFRDELSAVVLPDGFTHDYSELIQRLADLTEPSRDATATHTDASATCDVSQSCRGDAYPTERGIDSIYDWCFERLEGADGAEDELFCSIMRAIEDYRHPERATAHTVRAVDREALLALAEECDEMRDNGCSIGSYEVYRIARRIREACGEQAS